MTHADKGTEQPREQATACPFHDRRHPVTTWHHSGLCEEHRPIPVVSSRGVEWSA